ncbi:MAG: hypothetical protein JO112_22905 [Planctomycetes bacterium]|nr:hypothetical protein [Planctomycetota bacterium]
MPLSPGSGPGKKGQQEEAAGTGLFFKDLLFIQKKVEHITSARVRPRLPQVPDNFLVRATCFLQCVRQHSQPQAVQVAAGQLPLLVCPLGQADYGAIMPGENGGVDG